MTNNHVASTDSIRPEPWGKAPKGFHFEIAEQDGWEVPAVGAGRCRFGRPSCKQPAVATLWRSLYSSRTGSFRRAPWDYCGEHLYGRWIEDGKVVGWRLVRHDDGDTGLDLARRLGCATTTAQQSSPGSSPSGGCG